MRTRFLVDKYAAATEYCEGRIFFGKKGTIQTVWISSYIDSAVELIKKMGIKHIIWRVDNQTVPDKLAPYIKEKQQL